MNPLLRIYAAFPIRNGTSWFSGMPKVVTSDPLRYIIPINASKGEIMISYTDGEDARYWMKKSPHAMETEIMRRVRALFPDRDIPDPLLIKTYSWSHGCSYWKPGHYDRVAESKKSLHVMPGVFLCGESFAVHPCWMESAVEQTDKLLADPVFLKALSHFNPSR
jgi:monoamine oxidase